MENIGVKAVVRLVGINEHTLRAWERRYGALVPKRDADGHRLYSSRDVDRLKLLWALVKEGHSIGRIAALTNGELKKMLARTLSPDAPAVPASLARSEAFLGEIIRALQGFNLEKLNQVLNRVRFELSPKEIVTLLVRPLMATVGQLVHEGKLSIAQEHILSALLRDFLGNLHQSLSPYDLASRTHSQGVLLSTREGDIHEFGILLGAILANVYRFRTYYLGPSLPTAELVLACEQFKIDLLVIGAMPLPPEKEVVSVHEVLRELDRRLPRKVSIGVGGGLKLDFTQFNSERAFYQFADVDELDRYLSAQAL